MKLKTRLIALLLTALMLFLSLPVVGGARGAEGNNRAFAGDGGDMPILPGEYGENGDQPPIGNGDAGDEPTAPGSNEDEPTPAHERVALTMELIFILNKVADINETIYFAVALQKQDGEDQGYLFCWPKPLILHNNEEVGAAFMIDMAFDCRVEASELGYGVHELTVFYPGNEEFAPCEMTVCVTVRQKLKPVVVDWYPSVVKTGEPYTFGGRLVDENGAPIVGSSLRIWVPIEIGYVSGNYYYVVTDENGMFSCDVLWGVSEKEGTLELIVRSDDDVNLLDEDNYRYIRFSNTVYSVQTFTEPFEAGVVSGAGTYAPGDEVELTAIAHPGWVFKGWRMDGSNVMVQNNPYAATAKNMTATAVFEPIPVKHIELISHPDFEDYTVYTGRELVVRGRLTDDIGNTAASVGTVRADWDAPDEGEIIDVEHGEFTYTVVPAETGMHNLWFSYYNENDVIQFAVCLRLYVCENYIVGLELISENFKTEYQYGEKLDLIGLFIEVSRIDGGKDRVPVTEEMISRFYPNILGEQKLKVRYVDEDGYVYTLDISVYVTEEQKSFTITYVTKDVCPAPAPRSTEWDNYFGNVLGEAVFVEPANTEEYEFLGWCLDEEGSAYADYYMHVEGDVTLYALWDGPKTLITEVEIVVSRPKAGDRVRFYSVYDENSDSPEACGVALGADSVGIVKIVHAIWMPILDGYDWNDPAWHTFVPGVDYVLEITLEPEEGYEAFFKGHVNAYDADYGFDPDKAFVFTVNDLYDQNAIDFVRATFAVVSPVFRVHPLAPGDVNKDGKVDISDVTELLNALAGGHYDIHAVDIDENGLLSISDVTELLNLLAK